MKPLTGVRILSVEQFGAAPYGTMLLADLGAEVIKIESQADGGEPSRRMGPHMLGEGDSEYFQSWNLNKRSVLLDLKTKEGRTRFERLVAGADAVVNNLRGHLPAKLRLDYAALADVNPAIVCLHISAYGRDNERASWPGYDFLMQAEAGLMSLTGEPSGPPARFGPSVVDCLTGMTGTVGLLSAIIAARASGKGCDVDACLFDVALHQLSYTATWYLNHGQVSTRLERSAHFSAAPVQTFPTSDGWIFVMCMTERFWQALLGVLKRGELAADPRFLDATSRHRNRLELAAILDAEFTRASTADWLARLSGILPVAPVHDLRQALDSRFVERTGMVETVPHPDRPNLRVLACPVKINGERPRRRACSKAGADNEAILGGTAPEAATESRSK